MEITYTPQSGSPITLNGIFDAVYQLAKGDPEAGVETLGPAVFLSRTELAKLPVDPEFDEPTLTIEGVVYRVTERRLAGLGATVLALRRAT